VESLYISSSSLVSLCVFNGGLSSSLYSPLRAERRENFQGGTIWNRRREAVGESRRKLGLIGPSGDLAEPNISVAFWPNLRSVHSLWASCVGF
jgi:hypothetical protein